MILGKITGRICTLGFEFIVENYTKKYDYCQVMHRDHGFVLCQVVELIRDTEKTIAKCNILGFRDEEGRIRQIRTPFFPGSEVLSAEDDFVKEVVSLGGEKGAYIGKLESKDIKIFLDLNKLLTKHVSVLAKSGSGKSYTVGVLLEEIMEKNVPLLIIDPHGEYSTLKFPNEKDKEKMILYGIEPKGYLEKVQEYGDIEKGMRQLRLNNDLTGEELMHLLPAKLSNAQQAMLYSVLKDMESVEFDRLILELQALDNNAKWSIVNVVDYLKKLGIFSQNFTAYNELIQPGKCSIINLKGVDPELQEIIVYKLMKDLFDARKKEKIAPFFAVIEEAHNFMPERGFGEVKSSRIMRTIASEGRKFGLGLCVVSQRPARVDKSVLSQASTQIILKVTNPNDLKAISSSVEGVNSESEAEIQNLAIGTAMVIGVVDMPLFVNIRPRRSKHGGEAVDILGEDGSVNVSDDADTNKFFAHDVDKVNESKANVSGVNGSGVNGSEVSGSGVNGSGVNGSEVSGSGVNVSGVNVSEVSGVSGSGLNGSVSSNKKAADKDDIISAATEFSGMMALVKPKVSAKDLLIMSEDDVKIKTYLIPAAMCDCKNKSGEFRLLVEMVKGNVIMDIDKELRVPLIDLKNFSREELKIIEQALHMLMFTSGQMTAKLDMSPVKVQNLLEMLMKQGLFKFNGNSYSIDENLRLVSHPQDFAFYDKMNYERINDYEMIDDMIELDEIKRRLLMFCDVININKCFIVSYKAVPR